jgi:cobalt/nickel transport system permease protein
VSAAAHGLEAEVEVETALHRLPPECKVLATVTFIAAAALVPRHGWWAYGVDALVIAAVAIAARAPLGLLAQRLTVEIPFVFFVVLLPFFAGGEKVDVAGLSLSARGLEASGGIAAKATLAVLATALLAATTQAPAIIAGFSRLHAPAQLTAIGGFALRYFQVVLDELRRMQNARVARGDDPRWFWQAKAIWQTIGALTVRCFQRGERVESAMLARGYEGRVPDTVLDAPAVPSAWLLGLIPAFIAIAATVATRVGA